MRRISRLIRHRFVALRHNHVWIDRHPGGDGRRDQAKARAEGTNGRCVEVNSISFVVGIVPDTETYRPLAAIIGTVVVMAMTVVVHVNMVEVDPS